MRSATLGICYVLAISSWGQVTTGSISGYVFDPSGRAVPQAEVSVSDARRFLARNVVTDTAGFYRVSDLPPATYQVRAETGP